MTKWRTSRIEISRIYFGYNIKAWRNSDGTWNFRVKDERFDNTWIKTGCARSESKVKCKAEAAVKELRRARKVIPK